MNSDNVVSPAIFAGRASRIDAAKIQELTESGLLESDLPAFETLEGIDEVKYGDEVLGTLSDEETQLFINLFVASDKLEDMERKAASRQIIGIGEAIRDNSETSFDPSNMFDEEFFTNYFRLQRRAEALRGLLFWHLSARYGCFDYSIHIRTKRRVIKGACKWRK